MAIKTHEEAVQMLSSIDAALNRLTIQGIENAFIVAGSHNDILAVQEYLNSEIKRASAEPKPTETTEKK